MLKLMVVWGYGTPTKGDVGMGTHCPGAKRSRMGMEEGIRKKKLKNCWPGKLFRVISLLIMVNGS